MALRSTCRPSAKSDRLFDTGSSLRRPKNTSKAPGLVWARIQRWLLIVASGLLAIVVITSFFTAPPPPKLELHDEQLKILHAKMLRAEQEAKGAQRTLDASRLWLEATFAADEHLVATNAPQDIRAYTLSEIQRIALHHFPWNGLLSLGGLLQKVGPSLAARMLAHDEISTCCSSDTCLYDQVSTALILQELDMADAAAAHLQAAAWQIVAHGGNPSCRGMIWQVDRLVAPFDKHFPLGYDNLVDVMSSPAFWAPVELPLAQHLEHHSEEIVAELGSLCPSEESKQPDHFGPERVVSNLAQGSWTSLSLLHNGAWNASACETVAPRTCALLKTRLELQGAMRSASEPETGVQFAFVSVFRLRPQSHIHRHVGTNWRLNTHLGLVTPPGAKIRVWNEEREWQVGKALTFLDAAEHEVEHKGQTDRCVLNVVSWHPAVLDRRLSDPAFAEHFLF